MHYFNEMVVMLDYSIFMNIVWDICTYKSSDLIHHLSFKITCKSCINNFVLWKKCFINSFRIPASRFYVVKDFNLNYRVFIKEGDKV
jgi:hypothetical protein